MRAGIFSVTLAASLLSIASRQRSSRCATDATPAPTSSHTWRWRSTVSVARAKSTRSSTLHISRVGSSKAPGTKSVHGRDACHAVLRRETRAQVCAHRVELFVRQTRKARLADLRHQSEFAAADG